MNKQNQVPGNITKYAGNGDIEGAWLKLANRSEPDEEIEKIKGDLCLIAKGINPDLMHEYETASEGGNPQNSPNSSEKPKSRELSRTTGKKALEVIRATAIMVKKITSIVGKDAQKLHEQSSDFLESMREKLDEKYQIFQETIHENRRKNAAHGKKVLAAVIASMFVIGISVGAVAVKGANNESPDQSRHSISDEPGIYAPVTTEYPVITGPDIGVIDEKISAEPQTRKSETETPSDNGSPVTKEQTREEADTSNKSESAEELVSNTDEEIASKEDKNVEFSTENLSSSKAYENLTKLIETGEYSNIEADCTANYFVELCKLAGFSMQQTAAMLANAGHESQWCAMLKQVGGNGFGFFQFDGSNMYGKKGEDYYNNGNLCNYDGFKVWIESVDPEVYDYCFNNNPFENSGYEINDKTISEILSQTDTWRLYYRALLRQVQFIFYITQNDSWENSQMNKVENASDAYECTRNFAKYVERPQDQSDSAMDIRALTGSEVFSVIQKGLSFFGMDPKKII